MKIKCGNCGIEFKDKFVRPDVETGEKSCPKCHVVYEVEVKAEAEHEG